LGRANQAAPGVSPPAALAALAKDGRLLLPGELPVSPPAAILRALRIAFPELPTGFFPALVCTAPSPSISPQRQDLGHLAALRHPGIFPKEQDGFIRTSAAPASSSSRLHRRHQGFMITSLFDWFHQPVITSLPKLFHQRRQHRTFGICKDKRPERHLPIARPVPAGRASRPLGPSHSQGPWGASPCCENQPCPHSWGGTAFTRGCAAVTPQPQHRPGDPHLGPGSHRGGCSHLSPASPSLPCPRAASSGRIRGRVRKHPNRGHATVTPRAQQVTRLPGFASRRATPQRRLQRGGVQGPNRLVPPRRSPVPGLHQGPRLASPPVAREPARPDREESGSRSPSPAAAGKQLVWAGGWIPHRAGGEGRRGERRGTEGRRVEWRGDEGNGGETRGMEGRGARGDKRNGGETRGTPVG